MRHIAECCALLGILFLIGDSANFLLFKGRFSRSPAERISLAYGLGTGAFGLLLFYCGYAGAELSPGLIASICAPFAGVGAYRCVRWLGRGAGLGHGERAAATSGLLDYALCLVIGLCIAAVLSKALLMPMHLPDDRAQWGLKSKMIYYEKSISLDALSDPDRLMLHSSYPFLVPLVEAGFFFAMGEMNDRLARLPFAVYYICLLLFFYAAQRDFASHRHALLLTGMMAALPSFIHDTLGNPSSGYADVPLAFYYFIAVCGFLKWLSRAGLQNLTLAAVFMTFAIYTKQEGLYLWAFMVVVGLSLLAADPKQLSRRRLAEFCVFIAVPLLAVAPWFHFKSTFILSRWERDWSLAQLSPAYISGNMERIVPICGALKRNFFSPEHWNYLWLIFFAVILLYPKKSFRYPGSAAVPLLVLCNVAAVFGAVVLYPWPWWRNFIGDMYRVLLLNIPLVAFFISLQVHCIFQRSSPRKYKIQAEGPP